MQRACQVPISVAPPRGNRATPTGPSPTGGLYDAGGDEIDPNVVHTHLIRQTFTVGGQCGFRARVGECSWLGQPRSVGPDVEDHPAPLGDHAGQKCAIKTHGRVQ
jgi:hypothetical protein